MHRLRCIITADCQLLFNQMYVKRGSPLPIPFSSTWNKRLSTVLRWNSLMQHCGRRKLNCHCKLTASKSQRFYCIALPLRTLHADRSAVSITVPQWFDAPNPARLMSGCSSQLASVVSLQPSAASATPPTDNTYIYLNPSLNVFAMHRILIPQSWYWQVSRQL